jgi:hypothetical protein
MKNLFLVPTEKPSRLIIYSIFFKELRLLETANETWQHKRHLFITSDEEIKKTDWVFVEGQLAPQKAKGVLPNGDIECANGIDYVSRKTKKIILTTDQDLIEDGVQAIDDNFLEWFVKNPSCEFVKVEDANELLRAVAGGVKFHKIIIPQAEPKQETLKEAAANLADPNLCKTDNWLAGANYQAERMYSEEQVLEILESFNNGLSREEQLNDKAILSHLEQFKKK